MSLTFSRVSLFSADYQAVKELYLTAFPADERAPFSLLMAKANRRGTDFWSVYRDGIWVGMAYVVSNGKLSYLFYLAVVEELRGKGCGTGIVRGLKRIYEGQKFFLALEMQDENAPNAEERIRRRDFYLRCGLEPLPYHLREAKVTYDLMGIGGPVEPEEYRDLIDRYMGKTMHRIVKMEIIK